MIKVATITSVWDDSVFCTTKCKVDMKSKKIIEIEKTDIEGIDILTDEFVTLDGENYPAFPEKEIKEEGCFYYDY